MKPCYKRVLVKLSGEALSAGSDGIFNYDFIDEVCRVIKSALTRAHRSASLSAPAISGEADRA